ncbi:MAG: hypothetical protein FJX74_21735 [Armatimonadetes bacterium]|nr:hypothetical protein [Armatimonadota bacterium]
MIEPEPMRPEAFSLGTERRLFVEGKDEFAFDPHVLGHLLGRYGVDVRPVGGCENVMAAVHALTWEEDASSDESACTQCYSVIDRDYRPDDEVEATWEGGPFSAGCHLIWRRHDFENYFLEPEFVSQALCFQGDGDGLASGLLREAQRRVFYDAANLVVKELRFRFRSWHVPKLPWVGDSFADAAKAEASLLGANDWQAVAQAKEEVLSAEWLRGRFRGNLDTLVGEIGHAALQFGRGEWLTRMDGHGLIGSVLSERFFEVPGSDGKPLTGKQLWREVARDLMRRFDDLPYKPQDLVEVRDFFRNTQPRWFGVTDTAGSPRSR